MNFLRRYSLLVGLIVLFCIVMILLSIPGTVFSHGVQFIDTDLNQSSGKEAYIVTKMDFGSQEQVSAFPMQIGEWQGWDYDTANAKTELGADVLILRGYISPHVYQPVFLTIMQARTVSSFHPPKVCYAAAGYQIQEEQKDEVAVSPASWAEGSPSSMSVPFNRIVVFLGSEGNITERRVTLYCYVKGNQFTSDTITMIKVEAVAPSTGTYDGILGVEKDFIAQAIPYMFTPVEVPGWNPPVRQLAELGTLGYLAIALLLIVPIAIIAMPRILSRRDSGGKHSNQA
jgi:hypothetical protein